MKVKELIKKLQEYDEDKAVYIGMFNHGQAHGFNTEIYDISQPDFLHEDEHGNILIEFEDESVGDIPIAEMSLLQEMIEIMDDESKAGKIYSNKEVVRWLRKQMDIIENGLNPHILLQHKQKCQ